MLSKISIITVVFNNVNQIDLTINSVINQTYKNIEYIIIDGGSDDGTIEKISKYESGIDKFISEKDFGIYDAMNKGISISSGDYILFLNSGDKLNDNDTISQIEKYVINNNCVDILYGDVIVNSLENNFSYLRNSKKVSHIKIDMPANHQSCLINRQFHLKNIFDLKYKLASDYNFMLKSYLNGAFILRIPLIFSIVIDGGVSDVNRKNVFYEKLLIKNELNFSILNYCIYYYELIYFNTLNLIKRFISKKYLKKFYKLKYIRNKDNSKEMKFLLKGLGK